jgi:hypothetical protein
MDTIINLYADLSYFWLAHNLDSTRITHRWVRCREIMLPNHNQVQLATLRQTTMSALDALSPEGPPLPGRQHQMCTQAPGGECRPTVLTVEKLVRSIAACRYSESGYALVCNETPTPPQ